MTGKPPNLTNVKRLLPLRDVLGRTAEDDERRNQGFEEVKVKASTHRMPEELRGRGLDDDFYVRVRLMRWQAELRGAQFIEAVRKALIRDLKNGDEIFLFAQRAIPRETGGHILAIEARVDDIEVTDEKINR